MPKVHVPEGAGSVQERVLGACNPAYLATYRSSGEAVYGTSQLPFEVFEMARFRIAHINGCTVCMGSRVTRKDGPQLPAELYDHILEWRTWDGYSPKVRLAIEFAEKFALDHEALDYAFFDTLREHFSESEIVDLTFIVARHMAFGRLTHVLGLDEVCEIPEAFRPAA